MSFIEELRKAAKCIYIAAPTPVAEDLESKLNRAADEIEYNRKYKDGYMKMQDINYALTAENERLKLDLKAIRNLSRNYSAVLEHYGEIRRIAEQALADKDYLPKRSEK